MTLFRLDPSRPYIDGSDIYCPGCGQSYDTILDGLSSLPPSHYPRPTWSPSVGELIVGTEPNGGNRKHLCPTTGDALMHHLLRAQIAAAEAAAHRAA